MIDDVRGELHWLLNSPAIFSVLPGIRLMPAEARQYLARVFAQVPGAGRQATIFHVDGASRSQGGHRAEHLLAEGLRQCPGIDVVLAGEVIRVGARTVGELDLLYDDHHRACRVHCELTVRILLQRLPTSEWSAWCGTDPRLTLDDKLSRLRDHQLPLGGHPAVPRHPSWPTVSEALILGWLLQPVGAAWPPALGAAPDHLHGWWLRHGERLPPQATRAARFSLIPTDGWMAWTRLPGASPVLSSGELSSHLRRHFAQQDTAVLIAEVVRDEDGGWREVTRGAVVHARWPEVPLR